VLKTLLLNSSYEPLSFIPLRKLIKLIVKNKVEVISSWDNEYLTWCDGKIKHAAIVRLKAYVKRPQARVRFNKRGVFRRDLYQCQYCGEALSSSQATIDHIVPVSQGGKSTFENCCTSCLACNAKKANRTPEQANMKLAMSPVTPAYSIINEYIFIKPEHPDWAPYFVDRVLHVKNVHNLEAE
jgi:5-methylcytosine-specific restriction endonuclease McrA